MHMRRVMGCLEAENTCVWFQRHRAGRESSAFRCELLDIGEAEIVCVRRRREEEEVVFV